MRPRTETSVRRRPRGWWYPWLFVGGMTLVVVVNGLFIWLAIETFPGLETKDAYRKGVAYNETLAAARAQQERGWTMALSFEPSPEEGRAGELRVRLADPAGAALRGLAVRARLIRPTQQGLDFEAPLGEVSAGFYTAAIALPLPGQWDVRILAERDGVVFQDVERLFVP